VRQALQLAVELEQQVLQLVLQQRQRHRLLQDVLRLELWNRLQHR
jgi:hypothetical protein